MKFFTGTGDKGETSLFGDLRVRKSSLRVEAYGEVDELNTFVGTARSLNKDGGIDLILHAVQSILFKLGADLATPYKRKGSRFERMIERISHKDVQELERMMEGMKDLKPLDSFILPGGTAVASMLQICRAVCRRAERRVVALAEDEEINQNATAFLNRLSSLLFVLARYANHKSRVSEEKWRPEIH